jgi:hypothetical protein
VVPEQGVGIEPVEQLHHIVERAIGRHAEVEQLHRMRGAEPGDDLRFALEAAHCLVRHTGLRTSGH